MNKDQDNYPKAEEMAEMLKALNSKTMSLLGVLVAMRSDATEENKKIFNDLKGLIKQVNSMRKNMEVYCIIILVLMFLMTQKMLCPSAASFFFFT